MNLEKRNEFVVRLVLRDEQGRVVGETEAIRFGGLLHLAHEDGLRSVRTELLQAPNETNERTAIVRATVRTRRGTFTGVGDANAGNVNRRVGPHLIRVAETRAIARAFRTAVDVGAVCLEELADTAEASTSASPLPATTPAPTAFAHQGGRDLHPEVAEAGDLRPMTEQQRKFLFRLVYQLGASRDAAADRVLSVLGVDRFETATRAMAAQAIDRLKEEATGKKGADEQANGSAHG